MSGSYNILFWPDINYEPGHWRPVMSMAQKAKSDIQNCNIKFLCTPECLPIVSTAIKPDLSLLFPIEEIELILKDLFPVGYSSLASEKPEEARSRIDHCLKIAEGEFDGLLEDFKPHLLMAGYFVSMEALLIKYRYDTVIREKLRLEDIDVPPMEIIIATTFLRHPSEDPAITSLRFLAHHAQEHSSKLMQAATNDNTYNGSFSSLQRFISPLEDVAELITCPKILDHDHFKNKHRKNTHYVEPCILDVGDVSDAKQDAIYATAGSRVRDYVDSARTMFRILLEMIKLPQARRRYLEMAVGYTLKEEFVPNFFRLTKSGTYIDPRVNAKEWVEQTAVLKKARSAVLHGGLASIKESIYFGVRPIIIPFGKDQMDNALRVVNKKVGSMIMLDTLTPYGLYNTIMNAESNEDITKELRRMQKMFELIERARPSIAIIKRVLGIS